MSPKRANTRPVSSKTLTIYNSNRDKKMNNTFEQSRNSIENWEFHFKLADIDLIKSFIKSKDIHDVPLIIGAVILNQKDILLNLLKHGYNINEPDKNNVTPLMWSVKLKQLEMVQLLIDNNADPKIKTSNGDDIVCMALGSPGWDEKDFLMLFDYLKNKGVIDVNAINKHGLSLLHLAIRRDWSLLVNVLIHNNANVNIAATTNGVTPLMLACYRNDECIVTRLLEKGALVKCKNSDGFTALCYAYSSAITKDLKSPFCVVEKMQSELIKLKIDLSLYLKERFKLISVPMKSRHSNQPSPEQMLQYIFTFILRNYTNSFEILISELSCGKILKKAMEKFIDDRENLQLPLIILNIFFKHASFTQEINIAIVEEFINVGCFDVCLRIMREFEENPYILQLAMTPIIIFSSAYSYAQKWYEVIKDELICYLPKYDEAFKLIDGTPEQLLIIQERLEDYKLKFCNFPCNQIFSIETVTTEKHSCKYNTKHIKRKTKTFKAKRIKTKSFLITETLTKTFTISKTIEPVVNCKTIEPKSNDVKHEGAIGVNPIDMALSLLNDNESESKNHRSDEIFLCPNQKTKEIYGDWKEVIKRLPFRHNNSKHSKLSGLCFKDDSGVSFKAKWEKANVDMVIKYLEGILNIIANQYKQLWINDKSDKQGDNNDINNMMSNLDIDPEYLQNMEKEQLRIVYREFYNLTRNIKESYNLNPQSSFEILKELEKNLLAHNIRGETIKNLMTKKEIIKMNITMPTSLEKNLTNYMEGVIAGDTLEKRNVQIQFKELITNSKEKDIKIMGDCNNYFSSRDIMGLPLAFSNENIWDEIEYKTGYHKKSKSLPELHDKNSKWCSMIKHLEMMDDSKIFINGTLRISNIEKRKTNNMSMNGQFCLLQIGLSNDNKPLAVKLMAKSDPHAMLLKDQVDPLLPLRHKYLLHYWTCAYDNNLLIIATPLCEYNLGQYVLKMRYPQYQICKVNVIRQMLSGLMYLHNHDVPIIHGNLKPSNVLIDITGCVKVAEFGIYKAKLKTINLPESSIIWFATEIYKLYKKGGPLNCTCESDIQVAGMLVHFTHNEGAHPFGMNVPDILKNLECATVEMNNKDMELNDLLTWMLLGDPTDRPTIHQVLSHIFFWPKPKKWTYILVCAGLGITNTKTMDIEKLHESLDSIAVNENIIGNCWVNTAKKQYPDVCLVNASDTPSGLLKFIKEVIENNLTINSIDKEMNFSSFILNAFPHFVLSLFRMIENTEWSGHRVFVPFHSVADY